MTKATKPVPDGFHTVTPYLIVNDCAKAIDFYKKAFGAEEIEICIEPGSTRIMNAQLRIGNSMIMLNDEYPEYGSLGPSNERPSSVSIHLFVEDADTAIDRAVDAGATVTMPVADMFWGDRFGSLKDPFGHKWSVATRIEELTGEEIAERAKHAFA